MQALIKLVDAVAATGLLQASLDPDTLLAQARRRTGLDDLGEGFDDTGYRLLLEGCRDEARLHALGAIAASKDVQTMLCNRLRVVEEGNRRPQIAEQRIEEPLIITGLPRSGTTFLHRLLAQDPAHRSPATWEMLYPAPSPRKDSAGSDPRIARARRGIWWLHRLAPDFRRIHEVGPTLPEECIALMGHSFVSERFPAMYRIPGYEAWLDSRPLHAAYADHRRMLQHLQWRFPAPRWLLKAPAHLFALDALFATYPDAQVIQTHRDPARSVASWASFVTTLHGAFSHQVDPNEIGRNASQRWWSAVQRAMRERAGQRDKRFIDVDYNALVADPMGEIRSIYRQLDRPLTTVAQDAMGQFLLRGGRAQAGRHHYAADYFGLDPAQERRRFGAYIERFGIPNEPGERPALSAQERAGRRQAA